MVVFFVRLCVWVWRCISMFCEVSVDYIERLLVGECGNGMDVMCMGNCE